MAEKKLNKSNKHRMLCGVCGGFADFFGIDPTIVRLIFVVLACIKGIGLLAYVICAVVMPSDYDSVETEAEQTKKSEKTSKSEGSGKTKKAPHTDEEFDSYFKK